MHHGISQVFAHHGQIPLLPSNNVRNNPTFRLLIAFAEIPLLLNLRILSDRHGYGNLRGYGPRVSGGTGTGMRLYTPTKPVPLRRV